MAVGLPFLRNYHDGKAPAAVPKTLLPVEIIVATKRLDVTVGWFACSCHSVIRLFEVGNLKEFKRNHSFVKLKSLK